MAGLMQTLLARRQGMAPGAPHLAAGLQLPVQPSQVPGMSPGQPPGGFTAPPGALPPRPPTMVPPAPSAPPGQVPDASPTMPVAPPGPPPGMPIVPPSVQTKLPPEAQRAQNAQQIQGAYAGGWQPNPVLLRMLLSRQGV